MKIEKYLESINTQVFSRPTIQKKNVASEWGWEFDPETKRKKTSKSVEI